PAPRASLPPYTTLFRSGLQRVKDSFNSYPLDRIAQAGATAALQDTEYFQQTCRAIIQARDDLTQQLGTLGFEVLPSRANFVFARDRKSTRLNSSPVKTS